MPAWMRALVRLVLAVWFRSVETVGVAGAPKSGPLIVVGNHENGLLDPCLVAAYLPLAPRFLAKSTLWKIPVLWPFLKLAHVVPVYRQMDKKEGADPRKNLEMFATAAKVLTERGVIALFPEGESHNQPGMIPLKTGAARIYLSGPEETLFLPVGFAFDAKDRFRGRALMVVGEPLDLRSLRPKEGEDARAAQHAITDAIAAALKRVTINVPTWSERRLLERAVEIGRDEGDSLEARARYLRAFTEAYQALSVSQPDAVARLKGEVARYDRALSMLHMSDDEVRARYRPISVLNWILRFVRLFLMRIPIGVAGVVLHALPYQLPRLVSKLVTDPKELDQPASYKLMTGFVLYPLWWVSLAAFAFWARGIEVALVVLIATPITAWVALQWMERGFTLAEEARGWFLRKRRAAILDELRAQRAAIAVEIASLEESWRRTAPQGAAASSSTA